MICKSLVVFFMCLLPSHNTLKLQGRDIWITYNIQRTDAEVQSRYHPDAILNSKYMYLSILLKGISPCSSILFLTPFIYKLESEKDFEHAKCAAGVSPGATNHSINKYWKWSAVLGQINHTLLKSGNAFYTRPHSTPKQVTENGDSKSSYILTEVNFRLLHTIWMAVVYMLMEEIKGFTQLNGSVTSVLICNLLLYLKILYVQTHLTYS